MRQRYILWLGLFFFVTLSERVCAREIVISEQRVYVERDTLKLDLALDGLFSERTLDAIESGMTTSVLLEFRVRTVGGDFGSHAAKIRLEHDIWEGHYRVIRHASRPDTLETAVFDSATAFCSMLKAFPLGVLPSRDERFGLHLSVEVSPISPEQQQRTRRWLNLLEKGSLLELFISLDRPAERTQWIEIWNNTQETPE